MPEALPASRTSLYFLLACISTSHDPPPSFKSHCPLPKPRYSKAKAAPKRIVITSSLDKETSSITAIASAGIQLRDLMSSKPIRFVAFLSFSHSCYLEPRASLDPTTLVTDQTYVRDSSTLSHGKQELVISVSLDPTKYLTSVIILRTITAPATVKIKYIIERN